MRNITVTLTMLLSKDMTEKEIEKMIDRGVLHQMDEANKWTVKVEDTPHMSWDSI